MSELIAILLPVQTAQTVEPVTDAELRRLPEILEQPGVRAVRHFCLSPEQRSKGPYPHAITLCLLSSEEGAQAWFLSRRGDRESGMAVGVFEAMRSRTGEPTDAGSHMLVAFSDPLPGRDDEYNTWYWDRHFPDGLRLPDVVSGQRFKLKKDVSDSDFPYGHVALYGLHTTELARHLDRLGKISGTPEMPISPSLSPKFGAWWVQPASPWILSGRQKP